jgi:hypothetical protein
MLITKTIQHTNDEPYMEVHAEIPLRTIKEVLAFCSGTKYTCHAVMNLIKNVSMVGPASFDDFAKPYHDEHDFCHDYVADLSNQVVEQMLEHLEQIRGIPKDKLMSHFVSRVNSCSAQFKDWVDRMEIINDILEYIPDATLVLNVKTSTNGYLFAG